MDLIVSFSTGKDSTAVLLDALDKYPKEKVIPVFCDTKWEADEVYYYLEYIEYKLGVEVVRIESEGMIELAKRKKMMPNRVMRFCTENLKIRPFQRWLKENYVDKEKSFLVLQGVRREESKSRANTPVYKIEKSIISPKFPIINLYPIVDWTKDEVFDFIKAHNIEPNPLYKQGAQRVGCMPCVFASTWELTHLKPKYKKRVRELEKEMSKMLGKPVKFFAENMDRHLRQDPLLPIEIEFKKCPKCGGIIYIDDFCASCFKKQKRSENV